MVLLPNAIFSESISSTGNPRWRPEKGKCLVVKGHFRGNILYSLHQISSYTSHRNIIPTTMSMFVRSVSRLPLISMPHSRKRNPEYHDRQAGRFYLGSHPIATIQYILTTILMFAEKCQALYTPLPFFCINQTLVGFRGRCLFYVYIPSKPDRYGLNIWSMCDVSSIPVQPAGIPWKGR